MIGEEGGESGWWRDVRGIGVEGGVSGWWRDVRGIGGGM